MEDEGRVEVRLEAGAWGVVCGDGWGVRDSVEREGALMKSGCAPSMCPADPRARTSERWGVTSWEHWDGEWRHGDITVKCSVHKY